MDHSYPPPLAAAVQVCNFASTPLNHTLPTIKSAGQPVVHPFLKWAGSKRRILSQLLPQLPTGKRLVEPFIGGGSVFMATTFDEYLLADINPDLIALYCELKRDPTATVEAVKALFVDCNCSQAAYNALRARFNEKNTPVSERASLFVYLNKFAFNGLYRVNKSGHMNAPFAHHVKVPRPPETAMRTFAKKLQQAEVLHSDFATVMEQAVLGDVVYCDPPYVGAHDESGKETRSFREYDLHGFGMEQQERLAALARKLSHQGIPVVISNNDTPVTRQLYAGARLQVAQSYRSFAASGSSRGSFAELVAVFPAHR